MPGLWRVDCCLYFQHKELDRKNAQILCLPGHHLLELAGDGRKKAALAEPGGVQVCGHRCYPI